MNTLIDTPHSGALPELAIDVRLSGSVQNGTQQPATYALLREPPLAAQELRPTNPNGPSSLTAQALVVERALGVLPDGNSMARRARGRAHTIAQLSFLAAGTPVEIEDLRASVQATASYAVPADVEEPTVAQSERLLTEEDVAVLEHDYQQLEALGLTELPPASNRAAILEAFPLSERLVVKAALAAAAYRGAATSHSDLFTHRAHVPGPAGDFGSEAALLLRQASPVLHAVAYVRSKGRKALHAVATAASLGL